MNTAAGVFSATTALSNQCNGDLAPHGECANHNRVTGAIDAGVNFDTGTAAVGGPTLDTDIPFDFAISDGTTNGVQLTIPAGALYLFVTPWVDPSISDTGSYYNNSGTGFALQLASP